MSEICGVYQIKNKVDGKRYIGSSNDCENRLDTHREDLDKNSHFNDHLQNAWNKYGGENFNFSVIHKSDESNVRSREQAYFDAFSSANLWDQLYNYSNDANGFGFGDDNIAKKPEIREKIKKSSDYQQRGLEGESNGNAKLTENQVLEIRERNVNEDVTIVQLSKDYPVSSAKVGQIVRGEYWCHVGGPTVDPKKHAIPKTEWEEIRKRYKKEDLSHRDLAREYGVSHNVIGKIIRGEHADG